MQFAGLKELLKKKKEEGCQAGGGTPAASTAAVNDASGLSTSDNPYAAAAQSVLRSRAQHGQASPTSSTVGAPASASTAMTSGSRKRSRSPSAAEDTVHVDSPPRPTLLTRREFEVQRATMLDALSACITYVSSCMSRDSVGGGDGGEEKAETVATNADDGYRGSGEGTGCAVVGLPEPMGQLLMSRFVRQEVEQVGSGSAEEAEYVALNASRAELTSLPSPPQQRLRSDGDLQQHEDGHEVGSAAARSPGERGGEEGKLLDLIRALWLLAAAYWRAALLGEATTGSAGPAMREERATTHQSAELAAEFGVIKGWCYPAYLLASHALPDVMRLSCGRETASCLDTWRAARRSVNGALELVAYLLLDYHNLHTANGNRQNPQEDGGNKGGTSARSTSSTAEASGASLVVPLQIRTGLHDMVVARALGEGDFVGARQAYTDLTMGNANWRLGLFSAGEVHMRRSLEKLERNRVSNMLNNEQAMRLLHAVREVVAFAEWHHKQQPRTSRNRKEGVWREWAFLFPSHT